MENNTKSNTNEAKTYGATPDLTAPVFPPKSITKGDHLMLFDRDKRSIAYATNHSFSMSCETETINSKDHGEFGSVEPGKINWEISAEHLFTTTAYDEMFNYMVAKEPIIVYWGLKTPSTGNGTPANGGVANWTPSTSFLYSGSALITSLEATADSGSRATFSVTLTGAGDIKKVTALA